MKSELICQYCGASIGKMHSYLKDSALYEHWKSAHPQQLNELSDAWIAYDKLCRKYKYHANNYMAIYSKVYDPTTKTLKYRNEL